MNKKYDISTFGEILIDFTHVGDTPTGQKLFAQNPGGAPANVLVAMSNLGLNTAFLGKAGKDMHGEFLRDVLMERKVNVNGFVLDENFFTTLAFVEITNGERKFSFGRKPGADTQMTEQELDSDVINNSKIFHVGSLSLTHEPSKSATFYGIEMARKAGAVISYDPNYRASLWSSVDKAKEEMRKITPDIMKISDEETLLLTDCQEPEKAALALLDKGVKVVVVTLGGDGALVATKGECAVVKGFSCEVVDTTGAGDAFWGGFLYQVASSEKNLDDLTLADLQEFTRFANGVASLCVGKLGAIPAMPCMEDVLAVLK